MRATRVLIGGLLLAAVAAVAAVAGGATVAQADLRADAAATRASLRAMIAALTAPELAGRGAGTPQEHEAAALIAGWFAEVGLEPILAGGWLQEVPIPAALGDGRSVNAVGVLPGCGELAGRWIVLGAHLDHLGRVDPAATGVPAPGEYYPGAGDNASGIAAMLAAVAAAQADAAGSDQASRRSLLVCAFGAEEIGLVGSAHLAADLPVDRASVDAMLNLDAVGRLADGPLHVAGIESSAALAPLVEASRGGLTLAYHRGGRLGSDHVSFLERGIPALFLFTGGYPEMNAPSDSLAAVDLGGLVEVAAFTARLLTTLLAHGQALEFDRVPAPPIAVEGDRRTWFGSVPDFADGGSDGYRIGGLAEGGPAAAAGLQVGDRLLALGGQTVTDLAGFTAALRRHAPGDVVEVAVERGGRRLVFLVTLADRAERLR